jgi:cysteine-rich repeat protein
VAISRSIKELIMRQYLAILILVVSACGVPAPADGDRNSDTGNNPPSDAGPPPQEPVCGNGELEDGESCDDGNLVIGDGCDDICKTENTPPVVEDDHGNTYGDATTLPVGAPQRGIFETADDIDVFAITIAVAGGYQVGAEGEGTIGCVLSDGEGQEIASAANRGTCGTAQTLEPGRYFFSLRLDEGDVPSNYSVTLAASQGPEPGGSCGDGNRDFGEGCDDGNLVAGDGCDPNCQPEVGEDTHGDTRDLAAALAAGEPVAAAINVGGDIDYFAFSTDAAGEYQMETTGETDVYCHLEDQTGEEIATNDDSGEGMNCQIIEELEANSRYFLKVRGYSETRVGNYSVSVTYLIPPVCGNGQLERNEACDDGNLVDGDGCDSNCVIEDDFGNDIDNAHGIDDPSTTEANLIAEDADFFSFTAAASGNRQIHTVSTLDTFCHLFDAQGNELATNDDAGDRLNCQIVHELQAGETYLIKVRGFSDRVTGDYALHLGPVQVAP